MRKDLRTPEPPASLTNQQTHFLEALRCTRLFSAMPEALLERFAARATLRIYYKNHLLLTQDDEAHDLFVILNGWIKLFKETLDGSEAITDILTTSAMFGESAIFHNGRHPYGAEAIEPCTCLTLPLETLQNEIETSRDLALQMMKVMANQGRTQEQMIEHLTIQNAPQRIACFVLRLIPAATASGPATITLPYDKSLVAARLGMQPETFSRALKKLKDDVDLGINGPVLSVKDRDALVAYTCGACSTVYPCHDS